MSEYTSLCVALRVSFPRMREASVIQDHRINLSGFVVKYTLCYIVCNTDIQSPVSFACMNLNAIVFHDIPGFPFTRE